MRIIIVVFSLVAILMMTMSLMTREINTKNDNTKIEIKNWDIQNNNLFLNVIFYTNQPLYLNKDISCKTYNKEKIFLGDVNKSISVPLKKTETKEILMGEVNNNIHYIDCSFIRKD